MVPVLRFVILRHEFPESEGPTHPTHWDFMLERGSVLWTWSLSDEPAVGRSIPAVRLPDHRLIYLDYEGPVSLNRGMVVAVDRGKYTLQQQAPWTVHLQGTCFQCVAALHTDRNGDQWQFGER